MNSLFGPRSKKSSVARKRRDRRQRRFAAPESLERRAMLAFSPLAASGSLGGSDIVITADAADPFNELRIVLDDKITPSDITATITATSRDALGNITSSQSAVYTNFGTIQFVGVNDEDGSVHNSVVIWTSYEANLEGFEISPYLGADPNPAAPEMNLGLSTNWLVSNVFGVTAKKVDLRNADALTVTGGVLGGKNSTIRGEFESPTLPENIDPTNPDTYANISLFSGVGIADDSSDDPIVASALTLKAQTGGIKLSQDVFTKYNLSMEAAQDIELGGLVEVMEGDVSLFSSSGSIEVLEAVGGTLVHALAGGVSITAEAGPVTVQEVRAGTGITVSADSAVTILASLVSAGGDVTVTSENGSIEAVVGTLFHALAGSVNVTSVVGPISVVDVFAQQDIGFAAAGAITLNGLLEAQKGDINVATTSGTILLHGAELHALAGAITLQALKEGILQENGGVITSASVLSPGSIPVTAGSPLPTVVLTVEPPLGGGIAATASARIGRRIGPLSGVDEWYLEGIEILDPGSGYAINENPLITVAGLDGALGRGIGSTWGDFIVAETGVTIEAGGDVQLVSAVRATTGSIFIDALKTASTAAASLTAPQGTVSISGDSVTAGKIIADGVISLSARGDALANGDLMSARGGVEITSDFGNATTYSTITAEAVVANAQLNISVLGTIVARSGSIGISAEQGLIALLADVHANKQDIILEGREFVQGGRGVASIEVVDTPATDTTFYKQGQGEGYDLSRTTITISAPRNGGIAATAVPLIGDYPARNDQGELIFDEEEDAVGGLTPVVVTTRVQRFNQGGVNSVILTSPGAGYSLGEQVSVTIYDPQAESVATARATLERSVRKSRLLADVGNVVVKTTAGILSAQEITAGGDVILEAFTDLAIQDGVTAAGSVLAAALNGRVEGNDLIAGGTVAVTGYGELAISDYVTAGSGNITLASSNDAVVLAANVHAAGGSVVFRAHQGILQEQIGIVAVTVINGGENYGSARVAISPPSGGGRAATARAVVSEDAVREILAIEIIDSGSGYQPGEVVSVAIESDGGAGASAFAVARSVSPLIVGESGVDIQAGLGIRLVNEVRANTGDLVVRSIDGDLDLADSSVLLHAASGSVTLATKAGEARVGEVVAQQAITATTLGRLELNSMAVAYAGPISVTSEGSDVILNAVVSAETDSVTIDAFGEVRNEGGGVTRFEILSKGGDYAAETTTVTVLGPGVEDRGPFASPRFTPMRDGGVPAQARALVNEQGQVVAIEIVDPGRGYLPGDEVFVEIIGAGEGATAIGVVDPSSLVVAAATNVNITAGEDIELLGPVRAVSGDVRIVTRGGDLLTNDETFQAVSQLGSVQFEAVVGSALVGRISAGGEAAVEAKLGMVLYAEVDAAGDISLKTTHGSIERFGQDVSLVTTGGSISLLSEAGQIDTPRAMRANAGINIEALNKVSLLETIVAETGPISVKSMASDVFIGAAVSADASTISISAHQGLLSDSGGIARVEIISPGRQYVQAFTSVTITAPGEEQVPGTGVGTVPAQFSPPRAGTRAATARPIVNFEGQVTAIEIIDPGEGYLPSDAIVVTIEDVRDPDEGTGATARAVLSDVSQIVTAAGNLTLAAGSSIELTGIIRSVGGDVLITSQSGEKIDTKDPSFLAQAGGGVKIHSIAGQLDLGTVIAGGALDAASLADLMVYGDLQAAGDIGLISAQGKIQESTSNSEFGVAIVSSQGSIGLQAQAGKVYSPRVLQAHAGITVDGYSEVFLLNAISSATGAIIVDSRTSDVTVNAAIAAADGPLTVNAARDILSDKGGLARIDIISTGEGYDADLTEITVSQPGEELVDGTGVGPIPATFTPPRPGSRGAVVSPVVDFQGRIVAIQIVDPGEGYLPTDQVRVEIRDLRNPAEGAGAVARAIVSTGNQTLSAADTVTVQGGRNVSLSGVLRSEAGDVEIVSVTGASLNTGDATFLADAPAGSVRIRSLAGQLDLGSVIAGGTLDATSSADLIILGYLQAVGDIGLISAQGTIQESTGSSEGGVAIVSTQGSIGIQAQAGKVYTPRVLQAQAGVIVDGYSEVFLLNAISSSAGGVVVDSRTSDVTVNAAITAENGPLTINAARDILSDRGGLTRIDIIAKGEGYDADLTEVRVSAPGETLVAGTGVGVIPAEFTPARPGSRRAVVSPVVDFEGGIIAIQIVDPGEGYLPSDQVRVDINDLRRLTEGAGAVARAVVSTGNQTLAASSTIGIRSGRELTLAGLLRSESGDVQIVSASGMALDAGDPKFLAEAPVGSVTITAEAGEAIIGSVFAGGNVAGTARADLKLAGTVTAGDDVIFTTSHGDIGVRGEASVISEGGTVTLASASGAVQTPTRILAAQGVLVDASAKVVLSDALTASAGNVEVISRISGIELRGGMVAEQGAISLAAAAAIESGSGGITRIEVINGGQLYIEAETTVTIAGPGQDLNDPDSQPREGGVAAAGRAIVDDSGRITAIEVTLPGDGYRPNEQVAVRIDGGNGFATAVAISDPTAINIRAKTDVIARAGAGLEIVGLVQSASGDISLTATGGAATLNDKQVVIQAELGSVTVASEAAGVSVGNVVAETGITILAATGIKLEREVDITNPVDRPLLLANGDITLVTDQGDVALDYLRASVTSLSGGISIVSAAGNVRTPDVIAAVDDVFIRSHGNLALNSRISSELGSINAESTSGATSVNAVITAENGDVRLAAMAELESDGGGITSLVLVNGGAAYTGRTIVTVPEPDGGGIRATVRPIIEDGVIIRLDIVTPGRGYRFGEQVELDITDLDPDSDVRGAGAQALAISEQPYQTVEAGGNIELVAGGNLAPYGIVRSTAGNISALSKSGDVVSAGGVLGAGFSTTFNAQGGGVTISALAGAGSLGDVVAKSDIKVEVVKDLTLTAVLESQEGEITLASSSGTVSMADTVTVNALAKSIAVTAAGGEARTVNLIAAENVTVTADGDISLNEIVNAVSGNVTIASEGRIDNAARLAAGGSISFSAGTRVDSLGGGIVTLELLSGGVNYEWAIVDIAAPASGGGRAALGRANITNGVITGLEIIDPGYGYAPGERVQVSFRGNPRREAADGVPGAAPGEGAAAIAIAAQAVSFLHAGVDVTINAVTGVDLGTELVADAGKATIAVKAGGVSVTDVYTDRDISVAASETIRLGGNVLTDAGSVGVASSAGSIDLFGTVLAPAGGVGMQAASQIVQRGGSIRPDGLYLISGGRGYTFAELAVDPPPGEGRTAIAQAVITPYDPPVFSDDGFRLGYISDVILLDGGWGYPSDSIVNVSIVDGDGEGGRIVFATTVYTSSVEARDNVSLTGGDSITLISAVRSAEGDVTISNTLGDVAVQTVKAGKSIAVSSENGDVTLVSVAADDGVTISARQAVTVTDSVNAGTGNIAIEVRNKDVRFLSLFDRAAELLETERGIERDSTAVVASEQGSVYITSHNGGIESPYVINAAQDVLLNSFTALELDNIVTAQTGDIVGRSNSGRIAITSTISALGGSITLDAHTRIQQETKSGVTRIELLSPGPMVTEPPQVTVTVAPPRNGGTAATAAAIIDRRPLRFGFDNSNGDGTDEDVIEYEYFIRSIAILDPGSGYEVGEEPLVTIEMETSNGQPLFGALARAFGPTFVPMIVADDNVSLRAGEDLILVSLVRANEGNLTINSTSGNLDLADEKFLGHAVEGSILLESKAGAATIQQLTAGTNVDVTTLHDIDVADRIDSATGNVSIAARSGAVGILEGVHALLGKIEISAGVGSEQLYAATVSNLEAGDDLTVVATGGLEIRQQIISTGGDISLTSRSDSVDLRTANINAVAGEIRIAAHAAVTQPGSSGIQDIQLTEPGIFTGQGNERPDVRVIIAEPLNGGRQATAVATVEPYEVVRGGSGVAVPLIGPSVIFQEEDIVYWRISSISISDEGTGYAPLEQPLVTFEGDITNAAARAIGPVSFPTNIVAKSDVRIDGGTDIRLTTIVRSKVGDVSIRSIDGGLDLSDPNQLVHAVDGSVLLETLAGGIEYQRIIAAKDITLRSHDTLTIDNQLTTDGGDVTLASTGNDVALDANVLAAGTLAVSAKTGITQGDAFVKATNLQLTNITPAQIILGNVANDVDRFAATNVGNVTYVDADGFRVGLETVGAMGIAVRGDAVNLSSVANDSVIRVVGGLKYRTLSIAAGPASGENAGTVEYVVTSGSDSPNTPANPADPGYAFTGSLRDMIRYSGDNTATGQQAFVFDEPGYAVSEVSLQKALPGFTKPITFDGSRVLPSVPGGRLGILGRAGVPSGLYLASGSSGSRITGTAVYGFTTGSAVLVESDHNTIDGMFVGLRSDGTTVTPNRLGVNISGDRANFNTVGAEMFESLTDGVVTNLRIVSRGSLSAASAPSVSVTIAPPVGGGVAATAVAEPREVRPGVFMLGPLRLTSPGSGYAIGETPAVTITGIPGAAAYVITGIRTKANQFAGNSDAAIVVQRGGSNNLVAGNLVGVPGRTPNRTGVRIDGGSGNQVGSAEQVTDDLTPTPSNYIRGNTHYGIEIRNVRGATTVVENNVVEGNATLVGSGSHGIGVLNSAFVRIGGSSELAKNQVFSQLGGSGIHLSGSSKVAIVGNHIGTDGYHLTADAHYPDAVAVWPELGNGLANSPYLGNGMNGIHVFGRSRDVTIDGNRIVDNGQSGVAVATGSANVVLTNNQIGVFVHPVTGNVHAAGNTADGVTITAANGNTVGSGNVIGHNLGSGVRVENSVAVGLNTGNRLAGSQIFGNREHGVHLTGSSRQTIGGLGAGDGNVVKENQLDGIRLETDPRIRASAAPHGNLVTGNFVGTSSNEEIDRGWGNRAGIAVLNGVANVVSGNVVMNNRTSGIEMSGGTGNTVGGELASAGNFVGYNQGDGLFIHDQASTDLPVGVVGTAITSGGAGYAASRTTVIFSAPAADGGVAARGVAIISASGQVTGIRLTSKGSGYVAGEAVSVTIFDPHATAEAEATATLGFVDAVSQVTRGHVVSGNEIEANNGAGIYVKGDRTTEIQLGQDYHGQVGRGLGNKISFHEIGVLVDAAGRVSMQGNTFGDNASPIEMLNGANQLPGANGISIVGLASTAWGRGQTRVTGTITGGGAHHEYWVDVYATPYWDMSYDADDNGSGHQMRTFLGRTLVTTDATGRAAISLTVSEGMDLGNHVSVTLTSNRYGDGSTVGVWHSARRHDVDLSASPTTGSPTVTPTNPGGSSGGASTPTRGPVPPRS